VSDERTEMTEIEETRLDWTAQHLKTYLESDGLDGHVVDLTEIGGLNFTTCLLLEVVGRRSGTVRVHPLIYGDTGGEVIIVASKGGADVHPAWYWNLTATPEVTIQIAGQAFRASWREPKGEERAAIWRFMADLYPPYRDYQAATRREIPVVCFAPGDSVELLQG
jgi:deazaflavin-dependent oxidoreductase (nitroreductase family)